MPRKTKEIDELSAKSTKEENTRNSSVTKRTRRSSTSKSDEKDVKSISAKSSTKKTSSNSNTTTKTTRTKKTTKTSSSTTKKDSVNKKKLTSNSKTAVSKSRSSKYNSKKELTTNSFLEYYDLPYRYNQTVVKVLAQTPKMLFVYWDISDDDRKNFEEYYGNDFFSKTKPVLIVHNLTMNYTFEIEINDFANCWYLYVNDPNCKYNIELGRRPYSNTSNIHDNYIYITSSNEIDAPNNHILFEKFNPEVVYKNTKNNTISVKNFSTHTNLKNMQKIYNIYDLYKQIYKDELDEISNHPTNPSSIFKK